jgi:hypothetical protein
MINEVLRLCGDATVRQVGDVSLNRVEQQLYDYLQKQPAERQYWTVKVREAAVFFSDRYLAAEKLASELWRYFEERAATVPTLRAGLEAGPLRRTSMRNLAEYLLRLWANEPRPVPTPRTRPS